MTKCQNLFVALVNVDIFQMTLKFSFFTIEFELLLNFPSTFSKLKPAYGQPLHPWSRLFVLSILCFTLDPQA